MTTRELIEASVLHYPEEYPKITAKGTEYLSMLLDIIEEYAFTSTASMMFLDFVELTGCNENPREDMPVVLTYVLANLQKDGGKRRRKRTLGD